TRQADAANVLSADGGLSFTSLDASVIGHGRDPGMQLGWRVAQSLHLGDFSTHEAAESTRAALHVQRLDRGFASGGVALERGRLAVGAEIVHELSKRDALRLRHDTSIADIARTGPTAADVDAGAGATDQLGSYQTALQWSLTRGRWRHRVEGAHRYLGSTATLASGAPAIDSHRLGVGGD